MRYRIALSPTFQKALTRLAPVHQAAVNETLLKLEAGNASVHVHALTSLPWVSFCVSRDAVRVICEREGDVLLLVHVGMHDEAYEWARRHRPRRFGHAIRVVPVAVDEPPVEGSLPARDSERPPGPLAGVRPKDLLHFGIQPPTAALLRTLPDEDSLLDLLTHFPPALAEALVELAACPDEIGGILNRYLEAKDRDAHVPLEEAVRANVNAGDVWLAPPGQEALAAALKGDLASWKVFLHPSQRRLVEMDASGPVKVSGGPGTGKSVVALHRARFLAEKLLVEDGRPILLCTYSRVLARQLREDLESLCVDQPALTSRIEVLTLTEVAQRVLAHAGRPSRLLLDDVVQDAWREALHLDEDDRGQPFFAAERERVVLFHDVRDEDRYLRVRRSGRGAGLDRKERRRTWAVLSAFEAALFARGGSDGPGLAWHASRTLEVSDQSSPYAAVVCDEVQDAGPPELRLLRALASEPGAPVGANRLFLVGDGHQRLYRRPISLSACGIEVRGRSKRLRLNYRTTQGICAAAVELMEGVESDALDEEGDPLDGYRSLRAGTRPETIVHEHTSAEADWIVEQWRASKEAPLLVLARTRAYLDELHEMLVARGLSPLRLGEGEALPKDADVVLATLHRAKGLEAPRVILAGMQLVPARWPGESAGEKELWERRERSLVYVGMTRARDRCALSRVGS